MYHLEGTICLQALLYTFLLIRMSKDKKPNTKEWQADLLY